MALLKALGLSLPEGKAPGSRGDAIGLRIAELTPLVAGITDRGVKAALEARLDKIRDAQRAAASMADPKKLQLLEQAAQEGADRLLADAKRIGDEKPASKPAIETPKPPPPKDKPPAKAAGTAGQSGGSGDGGGSGAVGGDDPDKMSDQERKARLKTWKADGHVSGDTEALRQALGNKKNRALREAAQAEFKRLHAEISGGKKPAIGDFQPKPTSQRTGDTRQQREQLEQGDPDGAKGSKMSEVDKKKLETRVKEAKVGLNAAETDTFGKWLIATHGDADAHEHLRSPEATRAKVLEWMNETGWEKKKDKADRYAKLKDQVATDGRTGGKEARANRDTKEGGGKAGSSKGSGGDGHGGGGATAGGGADDRRGGAGDAEPTKEKPKPPDAHESSKGGGKPDASKGGAKGDHDGGKSGGAAKPGGSHGGGASGGKGSIKAGGSGSGGTGQAKGGTDAEPGGKGGASKGGGSGTKGTPTGGDTASKASNAALNAASRKFGGMLRDSRAKLNELAKTDPAAKEIVDAIDKADLVQDAESFVKNPKGFTAGKAKQALIEMPFDHFTGVLDKHIAEFVARFPDVSELNRTPLSIGATLGQFERTYNQAMAQLKVPRARATLMKVFVLIGVNDKTSPDEVKARLQVADKALAEMPGLKPYVDAYYKARFEYGAALGVAHNRVTDLQEAYAKQVPGLAAGLRVRADALHRISSNLKEVADWIMASPFIVFPAGEMAWFDFNLLSDRFGGLAGRLGGFANRIERLQADYPAELKRLDAAGKTLDRSLLSLL
jgi:hypothetical protein